LTAFDLPLEFCMFAVFVIGTVVGSFLNVCIYRIPTQREFWPSLRAIVSPPSSCPRCKNRIPGWCNVPVFGWLILRGRCFHCKGWISPRYPLIEFANGALFAFVYWMQIPDELARHYVQSSSQGPYGPGSSGLPLVHSPVLMLHLRYLYHLFLLESLIVASFIDLDSWEIPDGSTLPGMFVGVVGAFVAGDIYLTSVWHQNPRVSAEMMFAFPMLKPLFMDARIPEWISSSPHLHGLVNSVVGLVLGGGVAWAVRIMGNWALGREAMGFGDVILMALIGSFLGWQASVIVFFMAPLVALTFVILTSFFRWRREMPYGPYLSIAAVVTVVFWKEVWIQTEAMFGSGPLLILTALMMAVLFAGIMRGVRIVAEALGIASYSDDEIEEEWTSGDHLFHFAGETVDPNFGRWDSQEWPGASSSRGWTQYDQWRNGPR
jgi:leader peptidase (prepilin peptidase)/N-methyltransferase